MSAACQSGELVDRVSTWIESGELASQRVSLGTTLVPNARVAFDQDELTLVTGKGDILGADPLEVLSRPRAELDSELHAGPSRFHLRTTTPVGTDPMALAAQQCASSGLYYEVSTDGDVSAALVHLFQEAVAQARLLH